MEFRDLKKQYQTLKQDIDEAVSRVMCNANFISGAEVLELEEQLANYVGVKHCITCGNGTDALVLALQAMQVKQGDAVFVPDFTFFASAEAPAICGATPVFVDVEADTYNMSAVSLENAIQKVLEEGKLQPKVIIAVDLFGQPADYIAIREIATKYNLLILEDGAQGFGGMIGDKRACSFGDIATTSFFPAKPLGCYGDGGAVFTDRKDWAETIRSLRIHGKGQDKYDNVRIGMNSRLDTMQAAILQVKLKAFEEYELSQVNKVAAYYTEMLKDVVKTPVIKDGFYSSWAQYTIQLKDEQQRDEVQRKLKENGIPSMVYYKKAMHEQRAFGGLTEHVTNHAVLLTKKVLSLPVHPYLTLAQLEEVTGIVGEVVKG